MSQDSVSILMSEQTVIDKLHNDKPITKIVVSPNDQYLITYSSDVHWKIGSYWNLPILPIPSLPMPINFYWKLPMHIEIYICIYKNQYVLKLLEHWNLPILPIPSLPIPMKSHWKHKMHITAYD